MKNLPLKKIRTSGCAVGTVYGDMMEVFYDIKLNNNMIIIDANNIIINCLLIIN